MHKLKNKHTGEVITTPYMAEVEEYLNSGDYEMSDNKVIATFTPNQANKNKDAQPFDAVRVEVANGGFEGITKSGYEFHVLEEYWSVKFFNDKPTYTKEMHERGLLPKEGMKCLIAYKGGNTFKGKIKYISKDGFVYEREDGTDSFNGSIDIVEFKPIPTIEDELTEFFNETFSSCAYSIEGNQFLVKELTDKYNITPKGE